MRRLTNLAYPSAPADLKETLAKKQFVYALASVDMRIRIKQARPTSLNDAVRHAVELEAFHKAERSRLSHQGIVSSVDQTNANSHTGPSSDLRQLQESLSSMNKHSKSCRNTDRAPLELRAHDLHTNTQGTITENRKHTLALGV